MRSIRLLCGMLVLGIAFGGNWVCAQGQAFDSKAEYAPSTLRSSGQEQGETGSITATPPALFDIQFEYNATDTAAGLAGMAGACFFNGEFWVSRWQSDTILRFDIDGGLLSIFTIPGLIGTRSFTTDGTFIYAANSTSTIRQINPATQTLTGVQIISTANATARHCSYDSTLDNGNGGFWIGNFTTDISAISMSGTVLSVIPLATHGLNGMYGSAFDNVSAGGPYLWVFAQMGPNNSELHRLQLPSGLSSAIVHDAWNDFEATYNLGTALAGGLFITDEIVPNQWTLGGLLQGNPSNVLFGYELNDPALTGPDARVSVLQNSLGLTKIPEQHVVADGFSMEVTNSGLTAIDTAFVELEVIAGGSQVFFDSQMATNIAPGATVSLTTASYTPAAGIGTYDAIAVARLGTNQQDTFPNNDTTFFSFDVTDSTFARDDDNPNPGDYSITAGGFAYASVVHTLQQTDTLTSIWIRMVNPIHGDTTFGIFTDFTGGSPGVVLATSNPVILDSSITEYLLVFPGGVQVAAGNYTFGCYQAVGGDISLAQSDNYYTPDVNYFFINGSGWFGSSIQTARHIRPNFGEPSVLIAVDPAAEADLVLYPNPNNGAFVVKPAMGALDEVELTVTDLQGRQIRSEVISGQNGSVLELDLRGEAPGIYLIQVTGEGMPSQSAKVLIAR